MIVRMSKVEVIAPRDLLIQVLETVQGSGALQIDADLPGRMEKAAEAGLKPLVLDASTLGERLFYENLALRIDRLLTLLPELPAKETPFNPPKAIDSIAQLIGERIAVCEEKSRRRAALQAEMNQTDRTLAFLNIVESLVPTGAEAAGLDVIAVEVKDRDALDHLAKAAGRILLGADVRTARAEDGSYIGLLTTEKQLSDQLKEALRDDEIPEVALPSYLEGLPLAEKLKKVQARHNDLAAEVGAIDRELKSYAQAWRGLYQDVRKWLDGRLTLLKTSAFAYGTDHCFVLFGWVPSAQLQAVRDLLASRFGETVIVEEKEILEQDLERVPVSIKNPLYFQPFELLVRLLPLPRYTSIDPTPFIGIFFPLFFGMILGDVGYGMLLALVALGLILFGEPRRVLVQAGKILGVSSAYTIIFGVLYGECFGELGAEWLGLPTAIINRGTSLMPMLYFALAMGSVHVLVGMVLGTLSSLKGRKGREAVSRLSSMLLVLCIVGILASYFAPIAELIRKPLIVTCLVLAPILLLSGGLLAPFELLRSLGNIVSYARIMAVGLASVLLAHVANKLAGAAGSIWAGIAVAVSLHAVNIVLGVFAPTIHALRLHYVEFFSKFLESGGERYEPLKKDG